MQEFYAVSEAGLGFRDTQVLVLQTIPNVWEKRQSSSMIK